MPSPLTCRFVSIIETEGVQGVSGKPPACSITRQFCYKRNHHRGHDAPTTARVGTCHLMGFSPTFGARRFPKGNEGKRVSSGYNRRRRLATRSSGKQQAERTAVRTAPIVCPEESPLVRPQAHSFCRRGLTRRLRRERRGCRPEGVQYFLSKRKKVPKKASGTATTEAARPAARYSQISAFRALPCPALVFAQACQSLTAFGSCAHWAHALSRPKLRSAVAPSRLSSTSVRFAHPSGKKASIAHFAGGARLFPPSKWAGLFPFAAYRRSAPPQLASDSLNQRCLGCFDTAGMALQRKTADLIFALRLV